MKQRLGHSIPFLEPEPRPARPLYMRLYGRIREGVIQGAIAPGTRLPSARTVAREEGVSRNTVEAAFNQLRAEGFLVRRVGSGTRVADDLPERLLGPRGEGGLGSRQPADGGRAADRRRSLPALSDRGRWLDGGDWEPALDGGLTFAPCLPGVEAVPMESWNRVAARHARRSSWSLVAPPAAGVPALREAVAGYLHMNRGVRCSADQVVILNSTQQAIHLVTQVLMDEGDEVWLEDPGYVSARRAMVGAGLRVFPVPVDDDGIDVARGAEGATRARMAYVTPSHQYPLGVTLSLARRLELLAWASGAGSWIVEDDYDSELRYQDRPLASLQGMDESGRVLYAGTFNKILFPGLRIAYLVLPPELVPPFVRAKEVIDGFTPPLLQGVLADCIGEGHFSVHVRRARDLYRKRRDRLLTVAEEVLPDWVQVGPAAAGMHVALHLPPDVDDARLSERARRLGIAAPALSSYAIESPARGLLVHYGNAPTPEIEKGVRTLGRLLRESPEPTVDRTTKAADSR